MAELIVAFDLSSGRETLALAARLPGLRWAKVGPVLFNREGPSLIKEFTQRGIRVFLDLKWHDIPNIVASAVSAACELGVAMTTVHCLGGRAMLTAAAAAAGPDLAVLGVTVLTRTMRGAREHIGTRRPGCRIRSGAPRASGTAGRTARRRRLGPGAWPAARSAWARTLDRGAGNSRAGDPAGDQVPRSTRRRRCAAAPPISWSDGRLRLLAIRSPSTAVLVEALD